MLQELLRFLRTDSLPAARRLGLVHEHAAIAARHSRVATAWKPHLELCQTTILEAARHSPGKGCALIIGAGDCLDVPVEQLIELFDEVVLADVVVSPLARKLARRFKGRLHCALWDATGALATIAENRGGMQPEQIVEFFRSSVPLPTPGGPPDFIVSANCLSQLGLIPASALPRTDHDESFPQRCAVAAALSHLRWLTESGASRILLADLARIETDAAGVETFREDAVAGLDVRLPDKLWRWNIAPIPEWHPKRHRVHEVGAWIDPAHTSGA